MRPNTTSKIIGYMDSDGFAYCIKHARDKSEAIHESDYISFEKCCICGELLDDLTGSGKY